MIARRDIFPTPLSWQTQVMPPAWESQPPVKSGSSTWREILGSPQTKVFLALGMGMVLGWYIKRSR